MNRATRWLCVSVALAAAALYTAELLLPGHNFTTKFVVKLGGNVFSGFLTLGGFLLAMTNLVILRLQEKVYDSDTYRDVYESEPRSEGLYDPLVNLTGLLVTSVGACLASAILAITAAYAELPSIAITAVSFAVGSISLVFKCWWEMHSNFKIYFHRLESAYQRKRVEAKMKQCLNRDAVDSRDSKS